MCEATRTEGGRVIDELCASLHLHAPPLLAAAYCQVVLAIALQMSPATHGIDPYNILGIQEIDGLYTLHIDS